MIRRPALIQLILAISIAYLVMVLLITWLQDRLIYFPEARLVTNPGELGLEYQDITFQTSDGVSLSAWYVPSESRQGVILYCHGNGGNISYRYEYLKVFSELGLTTFMFDYRGYGKSEGRPSEKGTYLDAVGAWRYLVEERGVSPGEIIPYGESLGGAVAAWLARERDPRALILQSAFTSLPDVGAEIYPFLPVRLISRYHYSTLDHLSEVKCPVLVIHSRDDEIVPFPHGVKLHAAATGQKDFLELRGDHNSGIMQSMEAFKKGLNLFLERYPQR